MGGVSGGGYSFSYLTQLNIQIIYKYKMILELPKERERKRMIYTPKCRELNKKLRTKIYTKPFFLSLYDEIKFKVRHRVPSFICLSG